MLENMRNHAQSWMAKVILGGVALSFVLWGIGDYFRHSQIQDVATVDGAPITDSEFNVAYEQQMNRFRAILGRQFSKKEMEALGVKQQTLQTLINRRLILDEAGRMGLVAPQQVLVSEVRTNPAFQSNGRFDVRRYEALTRNMGYRTPTDFESSLRLDLIATSLQMALMQSAAVTEDAVHAEYEHQFEQRELAALVVDPSSLEKKINIDDKKARAYFDAHRHDYRSPLELTMNVVTIDPQKMALDMSVDEAAIKKAYEDHRDRYKKQGHVQPLAEVHEQIKHELALAKANDEAYKLSQDLDDALGREDTLKAAASDVNLKVVQYGPLSIEAARTYPVFGSAASRKALFERHPGDTIDVNELDNGTYAAIEILRRDEPADLPFDKVSKKVEVDARHAAAVEEARKLAEKLRKQAPSTPLNKLAQQHALPLYLSKPVRSNGVGDKGADWLSQDVLQAAFELKQGAVAPEALRTNKGFAIVQVKRIIPANPKDFEKQQASIRNTLLKNEGAARFARWMADTRTRHEIKVNQDALEKF